MVQETITVDYDYIVGPDTLAGVIANEWSKYKDTRRPKETEWLEVRNYLFATDTSTTTNNQSGMKNSTTRPKLTQIRDNLHANYMAALFPHEDFFEWQGGGLEDSTADKAQYITAYVKTKIDQSDFMEVMSQCVYDWIDYGNVIGEVVYENSLVETDDPLHTIKYIGPRLNRISPHDIVFNGYAKSFHKTPHIVRNVLSTGQLKKMKQDRPEDAGWIDEAFDRAFDVRNKLHSSADTFTDPMRKSGVRIDGFGDMFDYYNSGSVEVLEFIGDIYDIANDELLEDHKIIVVDRAFVVYKAPIDSWLGRSNREHVGWRLRPDNLWAMGPLDNLVGMQYRIDHLENLKADVFDQIAHPIRIEYGNVEDWTYGPGASAHCDVDARIEFQSPDSQALNADFEINRLEEEMEQMAGAPRQAMGIRTPGEKTKFEVQTLENNAGRAFQHKINYFERVWLEPILNQFVAAARKNLDHPDQARIVDADFGVVDFKTITKDDLQATGKLVPKGARHFARQAQLFQNLVGWTNSAMYHDEGVKVHVSGIELAKITQELLELDKISGLVEPNIRIIEQAESQQVLGIAEQAVAESASTNVPEMMQEEALENE